MSDTKAGKIWGEFQRIKASGRTPGSREIVDALAAKRVGVSIAYVCNLLKGEFEKAKSPLSGLHDQILKSRLDGEAVSSIARRHGVSRQAVYDVLNRAKEEGANIPDARVTILPKPCANCGKVFRNKNLTCSRECAKAVISRKAARPDSPWSRVALLELKCHRCGEAFRRQAYQQSIAKRQCKEGKRDFCSKACYSEFMRENPITVRRDGA